MTLHENPWDLFPLHRHLGTEEAGNEIIVDLAHGHDGPVFGLWHDPPAIVVLARNEVEFRTIAPDFDGTTNNTLPDSLHARVDAALTWGNTNLRPANEARTRLGATLATWLDALPATASVCDLRNPSPGTGFSWDERSTFARHPDLAVFARITTPPKPGLLKRLFG